MTTILVVEDEALIASDIQRTLIREGYEVPTTVATGAAAIEAAAAMNPGLVLMDIKLRGKMDGIEAAREIRARFGTPVVYLTSNSDDATLSRAVETQPYGYVLKPFNDRELRTAVVVAIQKHDLEARLAARERWFSTTLRSIGDAVIATDPHQIVRFMNGVAERLTGWGAEAIGRPISEVFRLVDKTGTPIVNPVGVALDQSFAVEVPPETGLVAKSGGQIPIDDSAAPIIDDRGHVLGGVVVFRDITERRRLEERLVRSERLASLGTMAAGMAHEINNPLTYVLANVSVAREKAEAICDALCPDDTGVVDPQNVASVTLALGEVSEALREAAEGAERVRVIVQDLKKFAGAQHSTREILDLPGILEGAIKMTNGMVRHHAHVRRLFGTTPYVEANEVHLGQVFTNLLINAAQAIGDGKAEANEITVATHTDAAGQAVVEIRDTGPGIRVDVLPRIFDPFFTTKPVGHGTGLGLAVSHSLVAALGGQLTAESPPGGGALFRVTLPAAKSNATAIAAVAPGPVTVRRGRVLIIDDERAVAMAMERMLRGLHEVTVVTDAGEALGKIASGDSYDVVLCDLMMPAMSGIEFFESLSGANPELAARIVFMTGGAISARGQDFLESTTNVQIAKPFSVETVRSIVQDYVK
jgi:two-component system cell cycle sensor histidine kinase/response regulator CckA